MGIDKPQSKKEPRRPSSDKITAVLAHALRRLVAFLEDNFSRLPRAARTVAYFCVLAAVLFIVLSGYQGAFSADIYGSLSVPAPGTGNPAARQSVSGGTLVLKSRTRPLRVQIDEDGHWSIPRFGTLPIPPDLHYLWVPPSSGCPKQPCVYRIPVELDWVAILLGLPHDLLLVDDPRNPTSAPRVLTTARYRDFQALGLGRLFGSAFAQGSAATARPAPPRETGSPSDATAASVERIISGRVLPDSAALASLSTTQRVLVKGALEDAYGIAIADSRWQSASTLGEVAQIVRSSRVVAQGDGLKARHVLRKYRERRLFIDPELRPELSEKITEARRSLKVPDSERVIAFLDATVFGSGDEGLLFGERGIYFRTWFFKKSRGLGFLPYAEFRATSFGSTGVFEVSIGEKWAFSTAGTGVDPERVVSWLNEIKGALVQ